MPFVFSYGTLQQPEVQRAAFGRELQGQPDELPNYAVAQHGPHKNIVFNGRGDSRVPGTIFELTDVEVAAADQYEAADDYGRMAIVLASGRQAWVYVARTA
jgi:gamma-glutamylcyclotransferase (GGCT)/AIG2-like uncharacterized protein YtfP